VRSGVGNPDVRHCFPWWRFEPLLSLAFVACASCTSVPPGVVSVEARGAIHSPAVWQFVFSALDASAGNGSSSSSGKYGSGTEDDDWSDDDYELYGARAAISTPMVDLVGGVDQHWFDDRGASEVSFGLRKRFEAKDGLNNGYVQLLYRRGSDLRTDAGLEDYDGFNFAIGTLAPLDEHWFLDFSLEFESTLERVEIDDDLTNLFSIFLNVGIGFSP